MRNTTLAVFGLVMMYLLQAAGPVPAQDGSGGDPIVLWLSIDSARIGPRVKITGQLQVAGGQLHLQRWMHEPGDKIDGTTFTLLSEHTRRSAAAAKLSRVRRSTLPKGLLIEVQADRSATLVGDTSLGRFELPLEKLFEETSATVLEGKFRLQRLPAARSITGKDAEEDFPSAATLPDGRIAVAYVAWDGKTDRVMLQLAEQTAQAITEPGDYIDPRCVVDGSGRLWVVWAANDGGQWDLWAWCDGRTVQLTKNAQNDFWPRACTDSAGRIWLTWQSVAADRHYEVMLAPLTAEGLGTPVNVSNHAADDWEPDLCSTADGRIVVVWDTYRNGSFDVYLREYAAGAAGAKPLGEPLPVAATARREAHGTVAADSASRVWIAWDVGMEDWGKHPVKGGTLHAARRTEVACLVDGKLLRPAAQFMQSLSKPLGKFVEYPRIAVDGHDRVWLLWRMSNEVRVFYYNPKLGRAGQNYAIWQVFASQFDGRRWTGPYLLAYSNGRQDERVAVTLDRGGDLVVVYAADGRTRRFPYMPVDYDVILARLARFGQPMQAPQLVADEQLGRVTPAAPDPELFPLPRRWQVGSERYCLVIGDTHRHTDISRCMNGYDGSLRDAYRYALDACGLDWLAISDHDQDLLKHRNDRIERPRQDYDWWRSQKYCDLYTIPGRFLALYGYEHGGSFKARGGHKNVVMARRGLPVLEVDAPAELFAALADAPAVVIPHQLADGGSRTDWEKWNPGWERVAEIFQTRGSYEYEDCPRQARIFTVGHSIWDALARDVRVGIIASSDHGQTHQARACVFVRAGDAFAGTPDTAAGFTRQGIVDGLRARRTFGSTIALAMRVSVDGKPMGSELQVEGAPLLEATIVAPAEVKAVGIVRNNRFVFTSEPGRREVKVRYRDLDLQPGQSAYYYVRALVGENDIAWSSPVWITRSK